MPDIYEIGLSILKNAGEEDYTCRDVCAKVGSVVFCVVFPKHKENEVETFASYLRHTNLDFDEYPQLDFNIDYDNEHFIVNIPIEILIDYVLRRTKDLYQELKDIAREISPLYEG